MCAVAVEHAHNNPTFSNTVVVTDDGRDATSHVHLEPRRDDEVPTVLPPDCMFPPDSGGRLRHGFWVRTYVDDAIFVELESFLAGRRCLRASQSAASDSFRLFGGRNNGEPPLFAPEKTSSWDPHMEVLGWSIDTVSMTIAVTQEKVAQLQTMLAEWPHDRRQASVREFRSLLGKLLHLCEVVRPGKFFVRRILKQLGLQRVDVGEEPESETVATRNTLTLGSEFHNGLEVWHMIVEMATGPDSVTRLQQPLFSLYDRSAIPHSNERR